MEISSMTTTPLRFLPLFLLGCAVGPDYCPPTPVLQDRWEEADPEPMSATGPARLAEWWKEFHDPLLDSLIDQAVNSNLELAEATQRIARFRAEQAATTAGFLPTLGGEASFSTSRLSENGFLKGLLQGGTPQPGAGAVVPGTQINLYQVGFDASWELDLFGRLRRSAEAAGADLGARIEDARDVLVSLIAEVGRAYVELRTFEERLAVARKNLSAQEASVAVVRDRREAGVSSDLDLARAEAELEALRARVPGLEAARRRTLHGLELLLRREPGDLGPDQLPSGRIPKGPDQVSIGIPANLLRRRPDLRRVEREFAAATARIGVAKADLYPRLTLSGTLGLQSQSLGDLARWDSRFWSAGPSLFAPLFEGGRLRARVEVQESLAQEALLRYEATLRRSRVEVENALVSVKQERLRQRALTARVEAEERAARMSRDLYANGLSDYLPVLDAMRSLSGAEDDLATSSGALATALIALYKAVGGGWSPPELPPPSE
jgi:NodT family efflux transporter outer membrane factor (OMF) lipoprotein